MNGKDIELAAQYSEVESDKISRQEILEDEQKKNAQTQSGGSLEVILSQALHRD